MGTLTLKALGSILFLVLGAVPRSLKVRRAIKALGCILFFALPSVLRSGEPPHAERPVLRVGAKQYTFKGLYGVGEKELMAEVDSVVKDMTVQQIRKLFGHYRHVNMDVLGLQKEDDRGRLMEALRKAHTRALLLHAAQMLVLAEMTDSIAKEHRVDLSECFDPVPLRDACKRYAKFLDFEYAHQNDPPDKDAELYTEAVKSYRVWLSKDIWLAKRVKNYPVFLRQHADLIKGFERFDDYGVKALILHDLLRQACEEGVYYAKAKEEFDARQSVIELFEVTGYQGSRTSLEDYFARVLDKEGDVAQAGIKALREGLKASSPKAQIKQTKGLGSIIVPDGNMPTNGKVYEIAPSTYRIYAIKRKPGRNGKAADGLGDFYKAYAYRRGAARFLPEVAFYLGDFSPGADEVVGPLLRMEARDYLPDVVTDKYVKKPYPSAFFAEFEEHRSELDESAVAVARMVIEEDEKGAGKLIEELQRKSREVKTAGVKAAYLALADRLSSKLKLPRK